MRGKDRADAPRALQREASRAALIQAAFTLASRPGEDPLDPASLAAEAGVSRPLFYRYFPTRTEFVESLLATVHGDPATSAGASSPPAADGAPERSLLAFFAGLAEPLDAHAALVRAILPRSIAPGPLAEVRARRRARAIDRIEGMLPSGLAERRRRASFLMDAFLGVQMVWCRGDAGESLASRVRRDMPWAIAGVLCRRPGPPAPGSRRRNPR